LREGGAVIVVACEQGSPQWHAARAGVITASMFSVARERVGGLDPKQQAYVDAVLAGETEARARELAGYKAAPTSDTVRRALRGERVGDFSNAARDYAFRLAIERIGGEPLDEGFETFAMRRGHELEPDARAAHEVEAGVIVQRCGFVTTDDGVFGGSADGLIGEHGGSEYKCLIDPTRLRKVLVDEDISEFVDQVQGCLWLTGRRWWHFALYCPALAPIGKALWWREVARDDDYIEAMERELLEFRALVDDTEQRLRANGAIARAA
jgi:hypothetical protein